MKTNRTKKMVSVLLCMMIFSTFLLQGCSLKEAETSRKVVVSENGKNLEVTLKSNTAQGYSWRYVTGSSLVESSSTLKNDLFSDTYVEKYVFSMNDTKSDTLILVLLQNEDYDNAKVFSYDVSFKDGSMVVGKCQESTLKYDKKLYDQITK